ncbi:hypothetical protein TeGR_g3563 [Tetraparma gracilis]|uniref:NAD(P)-binding protein n=1 Tax=Tetraparma gracilis TaxID=2962635 RepID=A0ABQ6NAN4_9STRA|nr:hypothetical protein TeGR_g3563 [Tetraparma gracilis]
MHRILVTGGNSGIGYALCKILASQAEPACHVLLGARSVAKGEEAVASIKAEDKDARVEFIELDVNSEASVAAAAASVGDGSLYAVVNNAGTGLAHNVEKELIIETNVFGAKRVSDAFLPKISAGGRLVNLGSGAAQCYQFGTADFLPKLDLIGCCPMELRNKLWMDPTWDIIEEVLAKEVEGGWTNGGAMATYMCSKALLGALTQIQAKANPSLTVSVCTPGHIATKMTEGFGKGKTPEEGTVSARHCLFADITSGHFWGSDALRSPFHKGRDPGTPEYTGE